MMARGAGTGGPDLALADAMLLAGGMAVPTGKHVVLVVSEGSPLLRYRSLDRGMDGRGRAARRHARIRPEPLPDDGEPLLGPTGRDRFIRDSFGSEAGVKPVGARPSRQDKHRGNGRP
jgi:hypothetical protein